jgi:hypothetical protein
MDFIYKLEVDVYSFKYLHAPALISLAVTTRIEEWAAQGRPKTNGTQKDWTERKNIGLRPGITGEVSDSMTKGARNKGTKLQ